MRIAWPGRQVALPSWLHLRTGESQNASLWGIQKAWIWWNNLWWEREQRETKRHKYLWRKPCSIRVIQQVSPPITWKLSSLQERTEKRSVGFIFTHSWGIPALIILGVYILAELEKTKHASVCIQTGEWWCFKENFKTLAVPGISETIPRGNSNKLSCHRF